MAGPVAFVPLIMAGARAITRVAPEVAKRLFKQGKAKPATDVYNALKSEISRKGFDDKHPILIHLDSDNIIDGNHRLAIANELKLDYVPVRFEYIIYN